MTTGTSTATASDRRAWLVPLLAVLLWATMRLEPQFFSNQNTKFLHGLAEAGFGYLAEDWMANTKDGLPAFTLLVRWTAEVAPLWVFYLEHFLLYVVYAVAVLLLFRREYRGIGAESLLAPLIFLLVFSPLHFDPPIPGGVAAQSIFNRWFEPANFGAFVLLGLWAFLVRRPVAAVVLINLAAAFHAGYVAPAAILLVGLAAGLPLLEQEQRRRAALALAFGLAALAVNALLLQLAFPATSPEAQAKATSVLALRRIPRHTDPATWFDGDAAGKLVLCLLGIFLARNRILGRLLAVGLAATVLLSLLVLVMEANFVRLITPWRVTAFLVPVAWIIVIGRLIAWLLPWFQRFRLVPWGLAACALVALGLAGAGLAIKAATFGKSEPAYVQLVQAELAPGQVWLTEPMLEEFRLRTGAPQYISFKTHPYLDVEVLEWARRLSLTQTLFKAASFDCAELARLRDEERVTHVLTGAFKPAKRRGPAMDCSFARPIATAGDTRLYRLEPGS